MSSCNVAYWRPDTASDPCTTAIVSSNREVLALTSSAGHLLHDLGPAATPAFFLASIDQQAWIPRVVVVTNGTRIRGFVYAKERKVAGLPTGLIYADATSNSMVVSAAPDASAVFKIAIASLTEKRRILGLRILLPLKQTFDLTPEEFHACTDMDVSCFDIQYHCSLTLPDSYESFLQSLGTQTRRNFRYYRRRFEGADCCYASEMKREDFEAAASSLLEKKVIGARAAGMERALRMLAVVDRPILGGLRDSSGKWLAIVGGWYEADRAVVFFQMNNDVDFPQSSLCNVLRGYLFESLIGRSVREVMFWAGVGGPILRHCSYLPARGVCFDRSTIFWRSLRKGLTASAELFPQRLAPFARWVSPSPDIVEADTSD